MLEITRCIVLSRVSTAGQEDNTSHDTQDEVCSRFAQERGWHIVKKFRETESGASYLARVETQAALTMLERDEADMLLLYDMSRYGRDIEYQQKMLKRITRAGKQLQFTTLRLEYDPYTGELTPESSHIFATFGSTTQMERGIIRRRMTAGRLRAAHEGRSPARTNHAFGYHTPTKVDIYRGLYPSELEGKPQILESEREAAVALFEIYDRLGSVRGASAEHWERGFRSRSGVLMRPNTVRGILMNPIYKGEALYGRYRHLTDDDRLSQGKRKSYRVPEPQPNPIIIPCEPLISKDLWESVNRKLKEGRTLRSGAPKYRHMLTGLCLCHVCGRSHIAVWRAPSSSKARLKREAEIRRGEEPREYSLRCRGGFKATTLHEYYCVLDTYSGVLVEHMVVQALGYALHHPRIFQSASAHFQKEVAQQQAQRKKESSASLSALEREIETLRKREAVAVEAAIEARLADNASSPYEAVAAAAGKKREALEAQVTSLKNTPSVSTNTSFSPSFFQEAEGLLATLADSTKPGAERGRLLSEMVESIYPLPASYALGPMGRNDKLGGIVVVLKTDRPGPYFLLWNRITERRGVFGEIDHVEGKITLEMTDNLPIAPRRPDGRLAGNSD